MAHAVIKARKLAGAISEVREKYATEAQSRGAQMHSMHGRQNFEAYWNFSLTFPEVLAFLSEPRRPLPSRRPTARGSYAKKRALNTIA